MTTGMNNSDGEKALQMIMSGRSSCLVKPANLSWIKFTYNGVPRVGLDVGDDPRPGTSNLMVATTEGFRTFKKDGMIGVKDITTLGDYS